MRPPAPPAPERALDELARDASSRKRFIRMMGGGAAASGLAVLLSACGGGDDDEDEGASAPASSSTSSTTGGPATGANDVTIVNFALTLEYVEADFYQQVIDSGVITDRKVANLAKAIGQNENEHVDALKAAVEQLGGTPVEKPRTRFEEVLAGGPDMILMTAATVENLGAAAYLGQAPNIESKDILAAALSIHSVEARHAAALNELVGRGFKGSGPLEGSIPDGAFAQPMAMDDVLAQVKPFLA